MSHIKAQVVRVCLRLEDQSEINAILSRYPWDIGWALHFDATAQPAFSCTVRSSNSLEYRTTLDDPMHTAHVITASQRFA